MLTYVITPCYKPDCPEKNLTASLISSKAPRFSNTYYFIAKVFYARHA